MQWPICFPAFVVMQLDKCSLGALGWSVLMSVSGCHESCQVPWCVQGCKALIWVSRGMLRNSLLVEKGSLCRV